MSGGYPDGSTLIGVELQLLALPPDHYLDADDIVECDSAAVRELAAQLRATSDTDVGFARAAYEWVRDEVAHSWDAQDRRVTLSATDVLDQRVGLCFAKSHLLVALLRAERVPAGLCYQRLSHGPGHVVHGLVAVFLGEAWHRLDVRGNNDVVDAQFSLDGERLAWTVDSSLGEVDYPIVHRNPAPEVLAAYAHADDALVLCSTGLPDALS